MLLKVVYTENGEAVPDKRALDYALEKWDESRKADDKVILPVSNYHVILAFRLLVKRGTIPNRSVVFHDRSEKTREIYINPQGELSEYPKDFCNTYADLLIQLI